MARALLLTLAASPAALAVMQAGSKLVLNWCDASSPLQQFAVAAAAGTVTDASGALCATQSAPFPAALTMQPCAPAGAAPQTWAYNTSAAWPLAFTHAAADGACTLWNTQGGPGYEAAGSTVGVYACSSPTPFDSVFRVGFPFAGALAAVYTSPNNSTFSSLCVEAQPLPPAPIGTPDQISYQLNEMACFYHMNIATMAGTQGCGGGGEPPDISLWNPSAVDTDAWVSAGVAMGCKRFIYVAKHGCGFAAWPSAATINGSVYPYSVRFAPNTTDIVSAFAASVRRVGLGLGFYYSVGSNAYCTWKQFPREQYDALVIQQLTELWTLHGPLAEVWCAFFFCARAVAAAHFPPPLARTPGVCTFLALTRTHSPPFSSPLFLLQSTAATLPRRRPRSRTSLPRCSPMWWPLAPRGCAPRPRGGWALRAATRPMCVCAATAPTHTPPQRPCSPAARTRCHAFARTRSQPCWSSASTINDQGAGDPDGGFVPYCRAPV